MGQRLGTVPIDQPLEASMIRITLISGMAFLAIPAAAHAGCGSWNVSGHAIGLEQSNGPSVNFDLLQDGENLTGKAYIAGQQNVSGVVSDGWIRGSSVRLRV